MIIEIWDLSRAIMTSHEIRQSFLNFFRTRNHIIVPSSSLLPDDPSVLLTTAGMQQFKPYYTGAADSTKDFGSKNTASIQKCFRTSCIDEVGDVTHGTFFEMLGNFSFGGYFKEESIKWAHEFITKEMGLTIDYVTVFGGDKEVPLDEESMKVWQKFGVKDIRKAGREDNFWGPTGKEGPCGPTTEIYINGVEIWNIVFNEYFCHEDKRFEKLKTPGIDTGMGLERLAMVAQGVPTIFETDLFKPLVEMILPHLPVLGEKETKSVRIIADHMRGATFLMADGVRPSNLDRGYILRRVLRRAIRHASLLKLPNNMLIQIIGKVVDMYGATYPELERERNHVLETFEDEEKKFARTIEHGMKEFEHVAKPLLTSPSKGEEIEISPPLRGGVRGGGAISGQDAFHLYDTYGFPLELTRELAQERGLTVDEAGFQKAFEAHQEKSRAGAVGKFGGHGLLLDTGELKAVNEEEVKTVTRLHTATHMLHKALREVLGRHVQQQGSDITAQRLRFDFTQPKKLTPEEIKAVEDLVNQKVKEDLPVSWKESSYEEAIAQGALAFFKEKYPARVKVYSVGDFSKEICGGPHVSHTAEIGRVKIIKDESCGAGVRRIRAVVE